MDTPIEVRPAFLERNDRRTYHARRLRHLAAEFALPDDPVLRETAHALWQMAEDVEHGSAPQVSGSAPAGGAS